jgi:hypothetical protein
MLTSTPEGETSMKKFGLTLAAITVAVGVLAQTPPPPPPEPPVKHGAARFEQIDVNHDGLISREEAQAEPALAKHFDEIDTDHDGTITREELKAFRMARKERKAEKAQTASPMTPPPPTTAPPATN